MRWPYGHTRSKGRRKASEQVADYRFLVFFFHDLWPDSRAFSALLREATLLNSILLFSSSEYSTKNVAMLRIMSFGMSSMSSKSSVFCATPFIRGGQGSRA